jgi:hypothetical protein
MVDGAPAACSMPQRAVATVLAVLFFKILTQANFENASITVSRHWLSFSTDSVENRLSTKQIRNSMLTSQENLYAAYGAKWLSYETGPAGLKIHNEHYFNICVSNEAAMNRTCSDFMGEIVHLVKRTDAKVSLLENAAMVAVIKERHAKFAALKNKAEKPPEENDKLSQAFLRQTYKWTGEIDAAFVKTYDDEKQKQ